MSVAATLRQSTRSVALLVDRRVALVVIIDVTLLLSLLIAALTKEGGEPHEIYLLMALAPSLLLGVPLMSDVVAIERRSGSLELALSSPGASSCFTRRVAPLAAALVVQGSTILFVSWLLLDRSFPIVTCVLQLSSVCALLAAISLFWAMRLKTSGAVAFAANITLLLLSRWLFWIPIPDPERFGVSSFVPPLEPLWDWATNNMVLLGSTLLFYLDARRRADRPECLLS